MEKVEELRIIFNKVTVRIIHLINCYQNVLSDPMKQQDNYGLPFFFFYNLIKYAGSQISTK